jgi:hypothetical protein
MQEARAIFGVLDRDIRQAYASANNPYTFFIATGDTSSGTVLNFTSLSHRVVPGGGTDPTNTSAVSAMPPQSGVAMIGYSLDANSGLLVRTETAIPNPEFQPQPRENVPNYVLSQRVRSIDLEFFDPNSSDPGSPSRAYWSYASNPAAIQSITGSSGGQTQDTQLPQAVQVTVQIVGANGVPHDYSTVIPIVMPTPLAKGQAPDNTIGAAPPPQTPTPPNKPTPTPTPTPPQPVKP